MNAARLKRTQFLAGAVRETRAYWHRLSWSVRLLTILGYVIALVLLLVTAFYTMQNGDNLGSVRFESRNWIYDLPFGAMIASIVGITLGWALLLAGASDFRPHLFGMTVCLFIIQLFGFSQISDSVDNIQLGLMWILILLVLTIPVGVQLTSRSLPSWFARSYLPLLEFVAWVVVVSTFLGFLWLSLDNDASRAKAFFAIFDQSLRVFLVFWFLLGLQAATLTINIGRRAVITLHSWVSAKILNALTVLALLGQLLLAWWMVGGEYEELSKPWQALTPWHWETLLYMPWIIVAPGLVLWALALWMTRRWTANATATLLVLSIASCVFSIFFQFRAVRSASAAEGVDAAIFGGLIFIGLMTFNLLTFGLRYAKSESASMPRTGRVLVYPGVVILISALMLFFISVRPQEMLAPDYTAFQRLQSWTYNVFAYGMVGLGSLYLIWVAWRRREQLVGGEVSTSPESSNDPQYRPSISERWATNSLGGIALGWITIAVIYNVLDINSHIQDWLIKRSGPATYAAPENNFCITTMLLGSGAFLGLAIIIGFMRYRRGTLGADIIAGAVGLWGGIISWFLLVSPVAC
jgi:hypothetical protein